MSARDLAVIDAATGEVIEDALQLPVAVPEMMRTVASPEEMMVVLEERRRVIVDVLQEGRDYGTIPGTNKPTLFKPGAERVNDAYGCYPRFEVAESEINHDRENTYQKDGQDKESRGLYRYVVACEIVHRATGRVVGQGIGSCCSLENKYISRPQNLENTILKMAEKRAFVAATLTTYGLSDAFTQDLEDGAPRAGRGGASRPEGKNPAPSPAVKCPDCQGPMWDNRPKKEAGQYSATAPDFKCKDKKCDGIVWKWESPGQLALETAMKAHDITSAELLAYAAADPELPENMTAWSEANYALAAERLGKHGRNLIERAMAKLEQAQEAPEEGAAEPGPEPSDLPESEIKVRTELIGKASAIMGKAQIEGLDAPEISQRMFSRPLYELTAEQAKEVLTRCEVIATHGGWQQ